MVSVQVERCSIFKEFGQEQQHQIFGISRDKTLHHIDTLYYAVFLNEPDDIIQLQRENKLPDELAIFLEVMRDTKTAMKSNPDQVFRFLDELEFVPKAFSMYEYCISKNECFDIFISSYLPNASTPRIVVQLRSRYLVLEGVKKAVEESFVYLKELLSPFGLLPVKVRENRIDYAFHTNLIQNPYKFFSDENLLVHLKTNLRIYQKIGNIGKHISIDTLNLGNRKSNNVYFRAYNKAREVIEMNYKSFFIERWKREGLISEFDKYVYEVAYELRSYRTGCLVGRLKWYLEYGSNDELKEECQNLLESDFIKSDNCEQIEKKLHNVIPEPTMILNIEFQTKRKFYQTCAEWLGIFCDSSEFDFKNFPEIEIDPLIVSSGTYDPLLREIYTILGNAKSIVDYLTGYGNVVSFVKDRTLSLKKFLEEGEPYQNWWYRIRKTPIDYSADPIIELYRKYDIKASIERSGRLLQGQIARLAMLKNSDVTNDRKFVEDMADALCVLNDNDMPPFILNPDLEGKSVEPIDYGEIRARKARQLRGIIKEQTVENKDSTRCD